jgi:hypothetical protein
MMAFLSLVLHVVVSPFKTKSRLEAEIIMLRHQLNVLRRRVPLRAEVGGSRPTALCLALSLVSVGVERHRHCPARDDHPVASDGVPPVLALEVALSWRSAKSSVGSKN